MTEDIQHEETYLNNEQNFVGKTALFKEGRTLTLVEVLGVKVDEKEYTQLYLTQTAPYYLRVRYNAELMKSEWGFVEGEWITNNSPYFKIGFAKGAGTLSEYGVHIMYINASLYFSEAYINTFKSKDIEKIRQLFF